MEGLGHVSLSNDSSAKMTYLHLRLTHTCQNLFASHWAEDKQCNPITMQTYQTWL